METIQDPPAMTPVSGLPQRSHRVFEGLLEISNFVGSVMLLDDILDRITRITSRIMGVPVCSIYLLNDEKRLVLRSNVGFERDLRGRAGFALGEGIPGWVAEHGEIVSLADARTDPRFRPLPTALECDCGAYVCVPLRIQTEMIGVMTARKCEVYTFTHDDVMIFETISKLVAVVIEKARLHEEKLKADHLAAVAISLSGVAHYIKNVLMTMRGGEHLVDQGIAKGEIEHVGEGWEVLKRANRKIRGLVENILNYCGNQELIRRPADLNAMVLDMLESLVPLARERRVDLIPELDENVGEVWIDPESIYDVLLNLVTNGIDAIGPNRRGTVRVRTLPLDGRSQICVEVEDSGSGIAEEDRDRIFNLFFTTKGKAGTGIGLAATRKIIEDHGGAIELHSEVGAGTTFRVFLPAKGG